MLSKQFSKLCMCVLTGFRSTFNGHRIGHINCFTFEQFILLPQVEATEAHNFLKVMSESSIHPIVNNGVHHTIWHCKPIKCQKQMRYIIRWSNVRPMIRIYVEQVIRQPAYGKYCDNRDEHSNDLWWQKETKKRKNK